jgi:hypothetical protein
LALIAAGCQDAQQRQAEHAVESYLRRSGAEGYDLPKTHCTRVARMVAQQLETRIFFCRVPTGGPARCDQFRATVRKRDFTVVLIRRGIDCIQPLGG